MTSSLSVFRWASATLAVLLLAGLGLTPVYGQGSSGSSDPSAEKLKQLKQAYSRAQKAAKAGNHDQAYARFEQALQLAQETEQSGAASQIQSFLQKLPKNWGNTAINNENWSAALNHFETGIKHAPEDAYMHYGKGVALVEMDSTEAGLSSLQEAITVGEETGNSRVSDLASSRIRGEFLARASEALNAENPTEAQANTALEALDEMQTYVDPNAKSLYYRARALFEKGEHGPAMETARRGLEMHQGSRSDAAKYYFIIAESQMQTGSTSEACQTFENAAYGDYKARAEHYLKNECEG